MPGIAEQLEDGIRYERAGELDRAIEVYQAVVSSSADPAFRSEAFRHQAHVRRRRCEWDAAILSARQSAETAKNAGLTHLFAEALNAEAAVYQSRGDFEQAVGLLEQVVAFVDDERILGIALQNLGTIAAARGNLDAAERRFMESSECFRRAGYPRGEAIALTNLAGVALDRKSWPLALSMSERALAAARHVGDQELEAIAALNSAEALAGLGEYQKAELQVSAAIGHFTRVDNVLRRVNCLRLLGDVYQALGDRETALRTWQEGLRQAREIGARVEESQLSDRLGATDEARA